MNNVIMHSVCMFCIQGSPNAPEFHKHKWNMYSSFPATLSELVVVCWAKRRKLEVTCQFLIKSSSLEESNAPFSLKTLEMMTYFHLVSIASIPEDPQNGLWSGRPPSSPRKLATWPAKSSFPFSGNLLCPWCWTILPRRALRSAVSRAEKIFPDAAQIRTVYLLFTHVLKEQQAFSILIRHYRRAELRRRDRRRS